jgi:hypothetical protein
LRDGVQARARTASEDDAFAMGHGGSVLGCRQATAVRQGVCRPAVQDDWLSLGILTDAKLGEKMVLGSP